MSDTLWERKFQQSMKLGKLYDLMADRETKSGHIERGKRLASKAMAEYKKAESYMLEDMER